MFYSAQILSKKGPLGTCWLASWSQRSLKRNEVFNCSLPAAVDSIINPEAPLALRLSGQLLLGLVRLYLRKLQFLEEDAGLALRGLARNAAAAGGAQVDLPDGAQVAPEMAITLQDAGGGYDPIAQFVGGELFPSFESSLFADGGEGGGYGGGGFQGAGYGAGGASVTVAQDISELFGSHWTAPEEERFEVDGDAMERRFSTELERLRSQGVEAPRDRGDMFFGGGQDETFSPVMDDELMAVPPEDLFAGPGPTPGKTPVSAGGGAPLPGMSHMRITPPSMPGGGAADLLPDIGGGEPGGATTGGGSFGGDGFSMGGDVEPLPMDLEPELAPGATPTLMQAAAAARRQRQQPAAHRRRRPQVDAGSDGRPATTLASDEIRKLLTDRKPLMTQRGLRARRQRAQLPPRGFDVAAQSEDARESELYRPSAFSALAPELLELYGRAMTLPGQAAGAGGPAAQRRRRSSRGTVGADEEAAAAAAAAAEVAAEQQAGPSNAAAEPAASGGFTAGGGPGSVFSGSDFAPASAGGWGDEDLVEDSQQQAAMAAAALFPAGPEDEGEQGLAGAERRGRVPLQPVPASGELGSIGLDSLSEGGSGGSGAAEAAAATSFTKNTALVLEALRREFAPAPGSKRRHPSGGDLAAGMAALSLDSLLLAPEQPRDRLDAARWFYESLVLRNTGFVRLQQAVPYGDIDILPTAALLGGGGGPGSAPPAR